MDENTRLGEVFFDLLFCWKNEKPKFFITLKNKKPNSARKENGMPFSGTDYQYFLYHLGNADDAKLAHTFRKILFNINVCAKYFFEMSIISKEDYDKVCDYMNNSAKKAIENHVIAMQKPEVLNKIRTSNARTAKDRGKIISKYWNDPVHRQVYLDAINDPDVLRRRIETFKKTVSENHDAYVSAMNDPERIKKISKSSSLMWHKRSKEDKKRLMPKPGGRSCTVNGIKMNKCEAILATYLNEIKVKWIYEYPIDDIDKTYYPDFFLPDYKLIIEHFGDWWHCNPTKFLPDEQQYDGLLVKEVWALDEHKLKIYENTGVKVLVVWESDLINNLECVKQKISEAINDTRSC
jgi:G:T-mismatch repair DNA endonuclease (very short patch repair protein)